MSSQFNSEHSQLNEIPLQEGNVMGVLPHFGGVESPFSSSELSHFGKPNHIQRMCITEVPKPAQENAKIFPALALERGDLENIEKPRVLEIQTPRFEISRPVKPFHPFVCNTLEVPAKTGFNYGANLYNSKNNKIICCPSNSTVHFYDADTLTRMKDHRKKQLRSSVVQMSYCENTDTYLIGCAFGDIYSYNATENKFNDVLKEGDDFILAITHLDENNFAFSCVKSGKLFFKNLESKNTIQESSTNSDVWYLHHLLAKSLLLAGHANGKITLYQSKGKDGKYPMIGSLQAHKFGKIVTIIVSANIKGKEYIITAGNDKTVKIWQAMKGRLRLLKVLQMNDSVSTLVYLEKYQMIVSAHHKDYISFIKLPHGKLEDKVNLGMDKIRNIFFMKDKNAVGVANLSKNVIKIVQLHPDRNVLRNWF